MPPSCTRALPLYFEATVRSTSETGVERSATAPFGLGVGRMVAAGGTAVGLRPRMTTCDATAPIEHATASSRPSGDIEQTTVR